MKILRARPAGRGPTGEVQVIGLRFGSSKAIVLAVLLSTGLLSAQMGPDSYERAN